MINLAVTEELDGGICNGPGCDGGTCDVQGCDGGLSDGPGCDRGTCSEETVMVELMIDQAVMV